MSDGYPYADERPFLQGVLLRRCLAWVLDAILIGFIAWILFWLLALFGVVTFGIGFGLMTVLPAIPFVYNLLSLLSEGTATPGQRAFGLTVRRNDDLGPPTGVQAILFTIGWYVTMATSGLLLVVALFTTRKRTLHDLVSGLVVVRTRALYALTAPPGPWNI